MGEVRITVGLAGVNSDGDMIPSRAVRREALVDTGATMTVISRRVAEDAGVVIAENRIETIQTAGGRVRYHPAWVLLQAPDCKLLTLLVAVSDAAADRADAEIILGHDYMQRARMVVAPADRAAGCKVYRRRKPRTTEPARSNKPRGR